MISWRPAISRRHAVVGVVPAEVLVAFLSGTSVVQPLIELIAKVLPDAEQAVVTQSVVQAFGVSDSIKAVYYPANVIARVQDG